MIGIISWIVLGAVAGAIAKWIMPGKNEPKGCLATIILGIIGGVVGGFIGRNFLHIENAEKFSLTNIALAVGGAVIVLLIYAQIVKKKG